MGYNIIKHKNSNVIICRTGFKSQAKELGVSCCYIEECHAEEALKKLKEANIGVVKEGPRKGEHLFEVRKGICWEHFDYNERKEIEYKD